MDKTLVILKPDAIKRKLVGKIINVIENKNYDIMAMKMAYIDKETAIEHYKHLNDLPNFNNIINYITSGKVIIMIVEGNNIIEILRNIIGNTNPIKASPGTIRGDYGESMTQNLIHASDSKESAEIEIARFFPELLEIADL